MKTLITITLMMTTLLFSAFGSGYNVGDKATNFALKNTDGKLVSLTDYTNAKGFIIIFTCNHCPFAQAYQDRIIALDQEYKLKGFPVIAVNPNDPSIVPEDSYEAMQVRAKEKGFTFPYLFDETQEVYKTYGATRTPHVFLLKKESDGALIVKYIGAIDDNYQDADAVKVTYLKNALNDVIAGKDPELNFTKAIGCTIKAKQAQMP